MDIDKLKAANNRLDAQFAADHKDFAVWWHSHPHCDPETKWAVPARVAYKCEVYRQEFLEAKEIGAT